LKSSKSIVEEYLKKQDWRVKDNSNAPFSFGGLNKYITAEVSKDYWLREVYPENIAQAYVTNHMYIHDLGGLSLYCCGFSLKDILLKGVRGVPNIPVSAPAKHFDSILNQLANLTTVFQNEIMGAVAFNSVDTLLAPFIKADNLNYEQVKQSMQNFIFSINSNSRMGSEPAFTNCTFDLTPSNDMLDEYVIIGGELRSFTYGSCQQEMDMFNRAFFETMLNGDAEGKLFAYPIPTYNINKRFDWDNPNNDMLWEMTGKYGLPYFANYINSDMSPEDARSMCCRIRLDLRELRKRNGGLFGSGDSTGSIGVVTLNLPRIAYEANHNENAFFKELDKYLILAKDSLEIKRKWLQENIIETNAIPAFMEYVGTLNNHFSTIGIIGMNEMCENLFEDKSDITTEKGRDFCIKVGDYIRNRLSDFQEETKNLFNFEATPAEACSYKLALQDVKDYPDIITQGIKPKDVYYTNSCHIPVNKITSINDTFKHQEDLQVQFTGGCVIHCYMEGGISGAKAKAIVKALNETYKVPYMSLSPISRYCDEHGYVKEIVDKCPICGKRLKKYQRITGYLRCIDNFNRGKASEFKDRKQLNGNTEEV
jgi:anaerobic ribonucleoside-triphosphate reductase